MPIYMDRHHLPDDITPEKLSELHQQDLHIEHKHNCKAFTYWLDLEQRYAFCLIQAPNEEAIYNLHKESHGDLPTTIIEVEPAVVKSFLGRISDPEPSEINALQEINDPAHRILMMIRTKHLNDFNSFRKDHVKSSGFENQLNQIVGQNEGRITNKNSSEILILFRSVGQAVTSAQQITQALKNTESQNINIGIVSGFPVTPDSDTFFEEAITQLTRFCTLIKAPVIINSELRALYHQEQGKNNKTLHDAFILTPGDERFINKLFKFIDVHWNNPNLDLDLFSRAMGLSKSQLYRKLMRLSNQSPNNFIRNYRLKEALERLKTQKGNISEIAFETGYNSVGYFSKQFKNAFGLLPSNYLKTVKNS
ncbi:nickel-binding protein [Gaetbulibacter sp. M240]|uniref:nickel-binding protein n=1 Tax=Gaetbulibacter sp. M240 TaxID=3126511 RepID=UPI00374E4D12